MNNFKDNKKNKGFWDSFWNDFIGYYPKDLWIMYRSQSLAKQIIIGSSCTFILVGGIWIIIHNTSTDDTEIMDIPLSAKNISEEPENISGYELDDSNLNSDASYTEDSDDTTLNKPELRETVDQQQETETVDQEQKTENINEKKKSKNSDTSNQN